MTQTAIFSPFFAMMLVTLVVWVYMYARRIPFIRQSNLTPGQLTPLELARISPPAVSNPSDNLKNLFEIPVLFYALTLFLYDTHRVVFLVAAWVFVGFRALHSLVHCTINVVIVRFWLYCVSTMAFWFMAVRAALRWLALPGA